MTDGNGHRGGRGEPSDADTGHASGEDLLARQLGELARTLQREQDAAATLDAIVHTAVDTIPGAAHAGITMVQGRHSVATTASTGDLVRAVDREQYESGEGPCLDALYTERTVRMADVGTERRWPNFTKRIADLGVGSMLSFQLFVHGANLGALNLYAGHPDAFDDESEHVGLLFATHAAVALAAAQEVEQMQRAVSSRDLIGQAKGILMERYRLTADQAFHLLVRASQSLNLKLRDIAETLASTGKFDTSLGRPDRS